MRVSRTAAPPARHATPEAAMPEAAMPDAAMPEAGMPDAATPEAGTPEAAMPEAAMPDAGMPEAAMPEAAMNDTWTHALARAAVRPLLGTPVRPNHLTTLRLLTGLGACAALALGTRAGDGWGGALWVLSAFLDRADGELARIGAMMSPAGHRYDYLVDTGVNAAFFAAIGLGLRHGALGGWAIPLGLFTCACMVLCAWLSEAYEVRSAPGVRVWSGAWGFHPDDALYLLGPAAWLGWLAPVLVAASAGTFVAALLTGGRLLLLLLRQRGAAAGR